jgi:micrococcal nuclease
VGLALLLLLAAVVSDRIGPRQGPAAPEATAPARVVVTPVATTPAGMVAAQVVRVVDGDTIEVSIAGASYTVRYIGVDTPETRRPGTAVQPYGPEATEANERLVLGKAVYLEKDVSETDRFGRLLRYVWVGDVMANEELVAQGYARVSTYPPDVKHTERFLAAERQAREAGRGLWGLETPEPTAAPSAEAASLCPGGCLTPPAGCQIKGNISGDGRKLYHLPGGASHAPTRIEPEKGERWFCTTAEAEAAGWQAAGR